jgi:thiosulfate dehydrogenase [quinone] large subunit
MTGLLGIGVALILGIGMRLAAAAGALLTVLMWTAVLPPASNPFMGDHLIYAAVLSVSAVSDAFRHQGTTVGSQRSTLRPRRRRMIAPYTKEQVF